MPPCSVYCMGCLGPPCFSRKSGSPAVLDPLSASATGDLMTVGDLAKTRYPVSVALFLTLCPSTESEGQLPCGRLDSPAALNPTWGRSFTIVLFMVSLVLLSRVAALAIGTWSPRVAPGLFSVGIEKHMFAVQQLQGAPIIHVGLAPWVLVEVPADLFPGRPHAPDDDLS